MPPPPIVGCDKRALEEKEEKVGAQVAGGVTKEDKSRKRRKKEKRKEKKAKARQAIRDQRSLKEESQNQSQSSEMRVKEEEEEEEGVKSGKSGRDRMEGEEEEEGEEDGGGEDGRKKRKRGDGDSGSSESGTELPQQREQKKQKKGKGKDKEKREGNGEEGDDPSRATPKPSRESPTTPRSLLKKTTTNGTPASKTKSVTFAVDVKLADGPFVTILSKPEKDFEDSSSSSNPDELEEAYKDSSPEPDDGGDGALAPPEVETTKPQIAYLLSYYQARSSWKFSKAKQVWILRQIWNTSEFQPDLLQSALWSYINGLPVQSLKDRLVAEAKTLAKQRRELLYSEELEDDAQYRRAKLVLTALGFDEIEIDDDPEEYITP